MAVIPHKSVYKNFVSVKLYNQPVNQRIRGLKQLLQVDGFFDWMNQPTTLTSSRSHLSNLVINQQPTGFNIVRLLLSVNVQGAV